MRGHYSLRWICQIVITLEGLTAAIGPAGDALYVPMRITGGSATGAGAEKYVVCGTDFAVMHADEKLVHHGNFVIADPAGDILVWYDGPSQAAEGAYDDLVDGLLPRSASCRLSVRTISTGPEWHALNRRPLLGVGSFDGTTGTLDFALLSVTGSPGEN